MVSDHREREIGEQIAEGYRRTPQGEIDEWGDLSDSALCTERITELPAAHLREVCKALGAATACPLH